ncbi:MAG: metal-dependent transcriptional regulator [Planctomycetaceae bacterium]|nr:MAG: metal-dependent transcriptional regulator [Planctomycetaceae bacterium]
MASLTVENYLKAILQLTLSFQADWVSTGQLAAVMKVSPGTVTSMLKTLAESGLASYKPYEGVALTKAGRALALRMLRRHRLLELFLVRTLDLTWDQVHEEAENMEHAVSDVLIDRIDAYLGRPSADPHGDPIPSADGLMRGDSSRLVALSECVVGQQVRIMRVINQQPEFLRYLSEHGLEIDATAVLDGNSVEAGIITMRVGKRHVSLGRPAAAQVLVMRAGSAESSEQKPRPRGRKVSTAMAQKD